MQKGFTLLELLIVIGILAILSTTMIMVINPAEMLKRARDSQRISDLNTLKSAIAYYLATASSINMGSATTTYSSYGDIPRSCPPWNATSSTSSATVGGLGVDGKGWIPINFASLSDGSPISSLPQDPNQGNSGKSLFYVYLTTSTVSNGFELVANMESTTYGPQEGTDGGQIPNLYEVGNYFGLTAANATSSTCFNLP